MKVIQSSGKRKQATARATLKAGKGNVYVNKMLVDNFTSMLYKEKIMEPVRLADKIAKKYDIHVTVNGGGMSGQSDAVRLAIARSLAEADEKLKQTYADYDRTLMIADIRRNEKSHPNRSKPRAKRQKSYR